jgi:Tol biopolymer transport system component
MKNIVFFLLAGITSFGQQLAPLTVEKIMRHPNWMGVAPSNVFWSEDGKQLFFNWNPDKNPGDSLYMITLANRVPQKVSPAMRRSLPAINGSYNRSHTKKLYERNGDIFVFDILSGKSVQVTFTTEREYGSSFSSDERKVMFMAGQNLFSWEIGTGSFTQLTDFRKGTRKAEAKLTEQEKWLRADQLAYFQVLRERNTNR